MLFAKRFLLIVVAAVALLLGLGPEQSAAQERPNSSARVEGTVQSTDGTPLPYASVALYDGAMEHIVTGTTSDTTGAFSVAVDPGAYVLKVSFLSFQPVQKKVQLAAGETRRLGRILLKPAADSLDEVVVRGERSHMQLSFEKRVFRVGKDLTAIGGSLLDVLGNVPSLTTDFKGNVSLRGSQSVRILINGAPSTLYKNGSTALQNLSADRIKEVQVITNPSARYQAEGSAGIINIILKKKEAAGFHGSLTATGRYPEASRLSTNLHYRRGIVNGFVSGSIGHNTDPAHSRTLQRFDTPDTSYVYGAFNDGNETDYHGHVRLGADVHLTDRQTLTASTAWFFEDKEDRFNGAYIDSTFGGQFLDRIDRRNVIGGGERDNQVTLKYENRLGAEEEEHTLSARANYEYHQEKELPHLREIPRQAPADTSFHRTNSTGDTYNLRLRADYVRPVYAPPVADSGKVEAGVRSAYDWLDNSYRTQVRQQGEFVTLPAFNENFAYYENVSAAYVTFSSSLGPVSYQLGLRGERAALRTRLKTTGKTSEKSYWDVFPSAFLTYDFNDRQSVQMSYSRRISRPYARLLLPYTNYSNSRSRFTGNPDLQPEYGNSFESQFLQYWETGSLLASVYYRHRTGVVEQISRLDAQGLERTVPINLATANAWGLEMTADKEFSDALALSGSANLFRSTSSGRYRGQRYQTRTNRLTGRLAAEGDLFAGLQYELAVRYYGPAHTIQGRRAATAFVNAALAKDLLDGDATLSLNTEDLFNTRRTQRTFTDPDYFLRQKFWEPSGIRLNLTYRINQEKGEGEEEE